MYKWCIIGGNLHFLFYMVHLDPKLFCTKLFGKIIMMQACMWSVCLEFR